MVRAVRRCVGVAGTLGCALFVAGSQLPGSVLSAQQQFEVFVAAIHDGTQEPAGDLTAIDIGMTENGEPGRVVRLEPYSLPVKLTIMIDNGPGTAETLVHFRNGLRSLIDTLPHDVEVGVVALAPNPRWLVRPTTDRVSQLRSAQLLTPDAIPPRFSEALVEYAMRLERDFRGDTQPTSPYLPVLVVLSTTGLDGSQVGLRDMQQTVERFVQYGVRTNFAMLSLRGEDPGLALAEASQIFVAQAIHGLTKGEYQALAASSRVATLLPEWGERIAMTHRMGVNQYKVTLERPKGASGPLEQLSMFVTREGYSGVVTPDGRIP